MVALHLPMRSFKELWTIVTGSHSPGQTCISPRLQGPTTLYTVSLSTWATVEPVEELLASWATIVDLVVIATLVLVACDQLLCCQNKKGKEKEGREEKGGSNDELC